MTGDLWTTAAVRSLEQSQGPRMDRKLLKPQVERRRRERMNRSLESLRNLLLPGPEAASQRRVEKAEILENTVVFLRSAVAQKTREGPKAGSEGDQYLDGFSACLHKAAWFLQTEGESRGLRASLPSALYQHMSRLNVSMATTSWTRIPRKAGIHEKSQRGEGSNRRCTHLSQPYVVPQRDTRPRDLLRCHGNPHTTSQPPSRQESSGQQGVWRPWP
ncbi:hairy and enhancer of split related-7 [Hoplias malabaricus]|uniref:hairy and enhancer of split related-7 n=1 Tax=Hoplias malabaricus TaxID=27720 RepID=UPI003461D1F4